MGTSSFQKNIEIKIDENTYKLKRKILNDIWQLEEVKTNKIIEKTVNELQQIYTEGKLTFSNYKTNLNNNEKKCS
ncbi:MAG: hypothetical protein KKD63_05945, partial [Proteobacteria bacterium]|nr:hypothetical protein [Desulfobulbaceae bacterium]MBU4152401.1 hypothetical protein [Pseudomonadota bacterium]